MCVAHFHPFLLDLCLARTIDAFYSLAITYTLLTPTLKMSNRIILVHVGIRFSVRSNFIAIIKTI